jgi:hypothetical protein
MKNHLPIQDDSFIPLIIALTVLVSSATFLLGVVTATNIAVEITREQTVNDCITHPEDCKKEYDYYQLKNKE